jgi:N-acetylated-alpha-linked acidic dipeptidase
MRHLASRLALGSLLALWPLSASPPAPGQLICWPPDARQAYSDYESALNAIPSRKSLLNFHQLLADEPHIAGTEGDARTIAHIAEVFTDMGLEVEVHPFWAYLCTPIDSALEIAGDPPIALSTRETILAADPYTDNPALTGGWNAFSGSGDVTANIVYANYATKADFATLKALGISCEGKIVLARYGGNYRGYKAKFAEEAGAVAVVIFTDPADSGYTRGLMYPEGSWANDTCIQRGSILTLGYPGDPLTPGVEATEDAPRLDPDSIGLPKIPVQPVGWQSAQEIMSRMTGGAVSPGWQGGMPLPYRVEGGESLRVRVMVKQERKLTRSANVIATLKGSTHPEQDMVIGAHHDAWGYGAADPLCGTICMLESARSFAEAARAGHSPARTIKFAAWGAEEFGIIGSTEWVEARRDELTRSAVGYINLDMAVMGPDFGSAGSPELRRLIADAARAVPQARDPARSVFDAWLARAPGADGLPTLGDMGGGSDHVGFLCHAAIPSCSLGGSGAPGTSYHSVYDTLLWYWKAVGEDYEPNLMVTRMTNAVAGRLADAPLLPYDPAAIASDAARHLKDISARGAALGLFKPEGPIAAELAAVEVARASAETAAVSAMTRVWAMMEAGTLEGEPLATVNAALLGLRNDWISDSAQPDRPWFRNLFVATDEDSGYAAWMLPGLRWAVEHDALENEQRVPAMAAKYQAAFEAMAARMEAVGR